MHNNGIAHRDLKPENILLHGRKNDIVKIADFGLSKEYTNAWLQTNTGSPNYVAPEILRGLRYDNLCDMWSVGVITYTLLCGYLPFYNKNQSQLYKDIMGGVFYFPDEEWETISDEAKDFIRKLFAVSPAERLSARDALHHPWIANFAPTRKLRKIDAHDIKKQKIDVSMLRTINTDGAMIFSLLPVNDTIWAGGNDGTIRVYDARTYALTKVRKVGARSSDEMDAEQLENAEPEIRVYSMLRIENHVWIGCEHNKLSITVWDPKRVKMQRAIQQWGMVKTIVYVDTSKEVWTLVPSAQSTSVVVYDANSMHQVSSNIFPDSANSMLYAAGRIWIGTVGKIYVVNPLDKYIQHYWSAHSPNAMVTALCESLAGQVWSCSSDGSIHVWNAETLELINNIKFNSKFSSLRAIGWCVWAGTYSDIVCFDTRNLKQQTNPAFEGAAQDTIRAIAAHGPTNTVWTASFDEKIRVWTSTAEQLKSKLVSRVFGLNFFCSSAQSRA